MFQSNDWRWLSVYFIKKIILYFPIELCLLIIANFKAIEPFALDNRMKGLFVMLLCHMRFSFSMPLLYHAYVYLEFLILACTIYILAPEYIVQLQELLTRHGIAVPPEY